MGFQGNIITARMSLIILVFMVGAVISKVTGNKHDENATIEMDVLTSGIPATLTSVKITSKIPTTERDSSEGISVTASTIVNTANQKSSDSNDGSDEESISMMVFIYVFIAASVFILAFFVYRAVTGKMKRKTKRYGVIAGVDMEMAPLGPTDDDDDDTTVFEVRRSRRH